MISTLHSIDSLLNQFDQLTKLHSSLLSEFENKFSDIKNPLRPISPARNYFKVDVNSNQFEPIGSLEDFRRRIIKYRDVHRPSNDNTSIQRVSSKSFGTTTEVVSLSKILVSTSDNRVHQPQVKISNKEESKSTSRRHARSRPNAFTMETVNRLSKPKQYNRAAETSVKKDPTRTTHSSPKTVNMEPKILIQTSPNKSPIRHLFRPLALITSMAPPRHQAPIQSQAARNVYF